MRPDPDCFILYLPQRIPEGAGQKFLPRYFLLLLERAWTQAVGFSIDFCQ